MIRGSIAALVTPFDENDSVNYEKLRELVRWHIRKGTDGILLLGTTGEGPALNEDEQDEIVRSALDEGKGKIPMIVSSGSNNTDESVARSIKYERMGADALLVITPYYNKPNSTGMKTHFLKIADSVDIPVYIYNVPARTGICIAVEDVKMLAQHRNIAGIKEASGDLSYVAKIAAFTDENFSLYSGNDDITIALMSMGAVGTVSVWANLMPEEVHNMTHAYLDGRIEEARRMQVTNLNLINAMFCETNPVPIKEMMNMAGMEVGHCRLPLGSISRYNQRVLRGLIRDASL